MAADEELDLWCVELDLGAVLGLLLECEALDDDLEDALLALLLECAALLLVCEAFLDETDEE